MSADPVSTPVDSPLSSRRARLRKFCSSVYRKAVADNVFFMAGAISYNLLLAVVPLFLLVVGLWGYVLRASYGDPSQEIIRLLENYIPATGGDIDILAGIESGINELVASRAGFSIVGLLVFIWLSTRLVGTLRIALLEVFDKAADRGAVRGKIFDAKVVVLGGVLLLLNVVITVFLTAVGGWGTDILEIPADFLGSTQRVLATLLAFASTWALFALVYWYVPAGRIHWRTAWVAATIMAVSYEVMKWAFGLYVTSVASYGSVYGNLATVVVLLFWIYYVSVGFVLSGEVAQVYTMGNKREVQIPTAPEGSA